MDKHHGQVLKKIIKEKNIEIQQLCRLLNLNKSGVYRLYENRRVHWHVIATIGRLIGHDFSAEFPELAMAALAAYNDEYKYQDEQLNNLADIFLVDDSEIDTYIFRLTLNQVNKKVQLRTFKNGETAINKLLEISVNCPDKLPDHVFLDLQMPVMDGHLFLKHFHRLNLDPYNKIKIHILTSSIFYSELDKYRAHPLISNYLIKPIKKNLIATIL
jgi:CheY-like chemotaxis protein